MSVLSCWVGDDVVMSNYGLSFGSRGLGLGSIRLDLKVGVGVGLAKNCLAYIIGCILNINCRRLLVSIPTIKGHYRKCHIYINGTYLFTSNVRGGSN